MADSISPIGMKIVADLSDFSPKLKTGGDDVSNFAQRSKQSLDGLQSSLSSTNNAATGFFAAIGQGAAGSSFSQATSQIDGLLSKLASGTSLWAGFGAAGAAAMVAIGAAASLTASNITNLTRLSRTLGSDNQDTQTLMQVFRGAGLDDDASRTSLLRFSGHIGAAGANPDGEQAKAFQNIGLDPSALQNRSLLNSFEQVVSALGRISNRFEQDNAAQAIFGRRFADLEPVIQAGSGAIDRARDSVRVGGVRDDVADQASNTRRYQLETERIRNQNGGTTLQWWGQWWDGFSTRFSSGLSRVDRGVEEMFAGRSDRAGQAFGFLPPDRQRPTRNREVPLDTYTPTGPSSAQRAADKMVESWVKDAELFTRSARAQQQLSGKYGSNLSSDAELKRTAEILRAEADSVSDSTLQQLRAQNNILSALERRADLERGLVSISERTRTSYEAFQATLQQNSEMRAHIWGPGVDGAFSPIAHPELLHTLPALGRANANAFLALQATFGSGPSSYANGGISADSMEGARYLADMQVRSEVHGGSEADQVVAVLQTALELQRQSLERLNRISQALENAQPLMAAPNGWVR